MNWLHQTVFERTNRSVFGEPHRLYQEVGTKPEIEIFDVGMLDTAVLYQKESKGPCHFQFILARRAVWQAPSRTWYTCIRQLPANATWSASGLSKSYIPVMLTALALGGNIRVGLEDNAYYSHGVLAESNRQLVERAVRIT